LGEPAENRRAEPPDQIAELLRIIGKDQPAPRSKFPASKKILPITAGSFPGTIGLDAAGAVRKSASKPDSKFRVNGL